MTTELGDLDFDVTTANPTADDAWGDADLDVDQLDRVLQEQKQRERQEKQKSRLEEHQRRLVEKQQHRKPV
uniref:PRP1_N domain-containing protein n=1 Tax=Panagrellus redivivus TaxID=6233 RepID=A0A7E4US05_PANRE